MPVGFPDYYGGLTLPVTVAEGGTGQTSVTAKALLYGAGSSALIETNVGTAGQVLQINSATLNPTFQDIDISAAGISGILPIANGGTGTATPTLAGSANIAVTGTWPNQTIAFANPLTASFTLQSAATADMTIKSLGDYSALIIFQTSAHEWEIGHFTSPVEEFAIYDVTRTTDVLAIDTSGNVTLAVPLPVTSGGTGSTTAGSNIPSALPVPVSQGGTGTATPALTGGANISITGTWPNNTIALAGNVYLGTAGAANDQLLMLGNSVGASSRTNIGTTASVIAGVTSTILRISNFGVADLLALDASGNLGLAGKLACGNIECALVTKYNSLSTVGVGIPSLLAQADLTGQTAATGPTTLLSSAASGFYRISIALYVNSPTSTSTVTASVGFTQNGNAVSFAPATLNASVGHTAGGGTGEIYIDNATNITYSTTWTSGGAGDSYDIHIRLEAL